MTAKYDLSILAIFKDEESFLPEWLDHYFDRNIDHIYLLNDGSVDCSVDIINQHSNKKNITLLHTSKEDKEYSKAWRQQYLYNKYYSHILKETNWIGIFDLDEFCYSPTELNFKNIIKQYEDEDSIQQLIIDWYWFGSNSFKDQPNNIINSFTKRGTELSKIISNNNSVLKNIYDPNWCCKSLAKTRGIKKLCHHFNVLSESIDYYFFPFLKWNFNISNNQSMFINHYIGATNYYFNTKVSRGSCNNCSVIESNKIKIYDIINLNEIEDVRLRNQTLSKNFEYL